MKTLVKTLFASALTAIVLSSSAFASAVTDKKNNQPEISSTIDFNKVVITGNARVELVQCDKQSVAIYQDYNKKLTKIMQKGDKLYISSTELEPVVIVVFMKDLQRIDAANTATVTTRGRFSLNVLQVFLKDEATAYVNADAGSLYTVIKDSSALNLKGSTNEHTLVKNKVAKLKMEQFAAVTTTVAAQEVQYQLPGYRNRMLKDTIIAERIIR
ncbi:GIN domain-containing protein [Pedobacter heparinus]|uniref:Putative auto-transporter adhesin head GIN domain-containing protein n=1 Tax=Pedobacter heparinus (strain ATCC 13125 / DSM 2366 / CIP 104194 / JCM 7457 / NBRC 12017 / NCIMB 9290 / NRRL B-14731 / HIM 762-3) TaxID=485917 RepID=C6XX45_PEDHD|nr:DUF2807 domain-containing protein [Pedobacter heparinus]ACU06351.1 hypothetical protein Phep_4160 [Pedobacter heparinus DSM 2366]